MAIASSGIISGLDVSSLIKASMVYERLPLERLQKQLSTTESKISAMGQIKSAIGSLQEAAKAISNSEDLYSYKASLSNTDVATVSTSGKATAGSYQVEVGQLATSHKLISAAGISVSEAETLTVQVGGGAAKDVSIKANASLSDVAKAINDADAGVSATVVNRQLVLTGKETGAANQISITSTKASSGLNSSSMTGTAAQDAELTIDGIAIQSASNTITDAVTGVDLTLKAETEAGKPIQLTISNDPADFESKLKTFVDAYNKARDTMKNLSSYDATNKSAAALNGDGAVSSALDQLRGLLSKVPEGLDQNDPSSFLANLGVETSSAGVLSVNTSRFQSAMDTDFASVAKSIAAYGSAFDALTTQMNASDGLIANRLDGLNATTSRLNDGISAQERRLEIVQARYEKQYVDLETLLSSLTTTSNYLTQQLASLSKLSSG
ncbi:MAG: flagellar filament capping protein FliD [Candidatus Accumulibacter sp.]|jgi:flagellar hook-associated protein 2|nr:flagellar filament capping protein FliD [Accumulibacter sp.]